jgi:DNA-binding NarL/FixJ family response regulator
LINVVETVAKHTRNSEGKGSRTQSVPACVWLVEDNHTFRNTVARVLSDVEGIECTQHFSNAEDALDALIGGGVPDVVLLDVQLPGLNGIEAIHKIKSISPATRIVILTAFNDHEKVFKAVCAGASGYLLKTSPVERIVESIHEAVSGGAPMAPQVASLVLQMFAKMVKPKQDYGLTSREQQILQMMTEGLIKKEVADKLSLSYHTVDTHLRNIYTKLHVHNSTGAVAKALKERLF